MLEAFAKAGRQFQSQDDRKVYENLEELQWAVMMDPTNEEKVRLCDEAEAALLAEDDYTTAADRGDSQPEYLKALDYDNVIVHGWRVYNLCRGKTRKEAPKPVVCISLANFGAVQTKPIGSSFAVWIGRS